MINIEVRRYCQHCQELFSKPKTYSMAYWQKYGRFCSRRCKDLSLKGKPLIHVNNLDRKPWNKGLNKRTDERVASYASKSRGQPNTPEQIEANRQAMLFLWQQSEFRQKVTVAQRSEKANINRVLRMSGPDNPSRIREPWNKGRKGCYSQSTRHLMGADKVGKPSAMKGHHFSPEVVEKNRLSKLKLWQQPEYVAKQMRARGVHPNKIELRLEQLLLPYAFKYIGDGQLVVAGKCPDFWNGDHKLIELFGDYWHRGENPEARIKHFRDAGYDCLVIWERELQEKAVIKARVHAFLES